MRVTKHNNVDQTFWIFYFLCVFGFLTQKQVKIDQKEKNTHSKLLKTNRSSKNMLEWKTWAHNQTMSQQIERINAWTCFNAYACVPFFTHTARAFRVISLEDWVLELWFSNLRVKFAKQEVMVSIIFITSPLSKSSSRPFDCLRFPLPFLCPLNL